jgi:hypothetical protein
MEIMEDKDKISTMLGTLLEAKKGLEVATKGQDDNCTCWACELKRKINDCLKETRQVDEDE